MVYYCPKCNYSSKRRNDLFRHIQRKTPCVIIYDNNNYGSSCTIAAQQNVNVAQQNVNGVAYECEKCCKILSSKQRLEHHLETCEGLNPLQCRVCLKIFKTRQGKHQHTQYVKCSPVPGCQSTTTITNNITNNNVTNNHNVTNNNHNVTNNIIRVDFGKECLKLLCADEDYLKNMEKHILLGKYAIPKSMGEIYFNDKYPENQTLKKERRNNKMVSIQNDGKWETRMFEDIYKDIVSKIERYHNKYFRDLQTKHEDTDKNDEEFKHLIKPLRRFAHQMLWFGWNCHEIRKIGLNLNDPEDEEEINKKKKAMTKIMLEHIYQHTDDNAAFNV